MFNAWFLAIFGTLRNPPAMFKTKLDVVQGSQLNLAPLPIRNIITFYFVMPWEPWHFSRTWQPDSSLCIGHCVDGCWLWREWSLWWGLTGDFKERVCHCECIGIWYCVVEHRECGACERHGVLAFVCERFGGRPLQIALNLLRLIQILFSWCFTVLEL